MPFVVEIKSTEWDTIPSGRIRRHLLEICSKTNGRCWKTTAVGPQVHERVRISTKRTEIKRILRITNDEDLKKIYFECRWNRINTHTYTHVNCLSLFVTCDYNLYTSHCKDVFWDLNFRTLFDNFNIIFEFSLFKV